MSKEKVVVLDHLRILRITERFAHQIIENHNLEKEIVLIGIKGRGEVLAERINYTLQNISQFKIDFACIDIDKDNPLDKETLLSVDPKSIANKVVILIDDVVNSARTLMYSICFLAQYDPKEIRTAVLVDRIHRKFPVKIDYVGITLSTNLHEHVSVSFGKKSDYAYIS